MKGQEFKRAVHYQDDILKEAKSNPIGVFMEWPIYEVRKYCIEQLKETALHEDHFAEWAESTILWILSGDCSWREVDFLPEILSWYIYNAKNDRLSIRAIEFTIRISKMENGIKASLASKLIAGKIEDICKFYPMIPSLKKFLCKLLDVMVSMGLRDNVDNDDEDNKYSFQDWILAERAQKVIVAIGDFSFLWKIDEIIAMIENGILSSWDNYPPETRDMHLARLRFTRKALLKAKKEAEQTKAKSFLEKSATDLAGSFFLPNA